MFFSIKPRLICILLLTISTFAQAQIGIGTATPVSSAKLDITSTTKGFLPPRMTLIQRNAITAPVAGLQVWCTNCGTYGEQQVFNGITWTNMIGGTASASAPDAPTSPSAVAGNAQATISFTAPAYNGGSAITGYTVTSSPGGFTATGSASPLTVTGLTNGTPYTFTVVATNGSVNSAPSTATAAVTPITVPGAPTISTLTNGSMKVQIAFTAPASTGGSTITSYKVTASPGGANASGGSSPIIVSGLTNGVSYTFTVVAINAAGNSAASVVSNALTPNCGAYTSATNYQIFGCYNLGVTTTVDPMIGANQTSALYGDFYQWGRKTDGHEKQNSDTVKTQATNNEATLPSRVIGKLICSASDWSSVTNNSLWGDGSGGTNLNPGKTTNDPCPTGFKVPSISQLGSIFKSNLTSDAPGTATNNTWTWTGNGYTVGLGLYLAATGFRNGNNGTFGQTGLGHFWSSTNNPSLSTESWVLIFSSVNVNTSYSVPRVHCATIRCVAE